MESTAAVSARNYASACCAFPAFRIRNFPGARLRAPLRFRPGRNEAGIPKRGVQRHNMSNRNCLEVEAGNREVIQHDEIGINSG